MAVENLRLPYEILIRLNEDGTIRAAQYQQLYRVVIDGEVVKNDPGPAVPVSVGEPLETLLGTATTQALADNAALQTALANAEQTIEQLMQGIVPSPPPSMTSLDGADAGATIFERLGA